MFAICTFLITFFRETQYSSLDDKNFVLTLSSVEHHRTVSFQEAVALFQIGSLTDE